MVDCGLHALWPTQACDSRISFFFDAQQTFEDKLRSYMPALLGRLGLEAVLKRDVSILTTMTSAGTSVGQHTQITQPASD